MGLLKWLRERRERRRYNDELDRRTIQAMEKRGPGLLDIFTGIGSGFGHNASWAARLRAETRAKMERERGK